MPQPSLLTSLLIALLPVLLPALILTGLLDDPRLQLRCSDLLSGCMLLLAAVQLLRWLEQRRPGLLLHSLGALLPALLVLLDLLPVDSPALSVNLQATLLSTLLLFTLYPRRYRHGQSLQPEAPSAATAQPPAAHPEPDSDFLTRLSHEMRTPLNGVLGMTELLSTTPLSPRQRDYVKTLQGAGNELLQRINELFDLGALVSGELELEQEAFDLAPLLLQTLDNFSVTSGLGSEQVQLKLDAELPASCEGDPGRLRQILHDLLGNALRRCGRSGRIRLQVQYDSPGRLLLRLHDNGPAVPGDEIQRLLATPFTHRTYLRARIENREAGLLRCHRLARLMGGRLQLESPGEGGLIVQVSLPLQVVTTEDSPLQLSDARVLIVDASASSRSVLAGHCRSWGIEVDSATCAAEALAMLSSQGEMDSQYDLLLVDQDLPDGALTLAARIREDARLPQDMLLILLGSGSGTMAARQAGFNRILGRPVASYSLRATLDEELARLFASRRLSSRQLPELHLPAGCRVLVAEDDDISARVVRGLLARINIEPTVVGNGQQAVEAMASEHWDLVLMDCDMPVMDGFTATQCQRRREHELQLPRLPIIALSAHVLEAQRQRMAAAGMDDLLAKPLELQQLCHAIERQLGQPV